MTSHRTGQTGDDFFLWFRLYGSEERLFTKSWIFPDGSRNSGHTTPLMTLLRHADCIEQCPLSVIRKTFAHTEFFSV